MKTVADIVVIGGGVHGASLAFHLAKSKAGKVVLVEKKHLAAGPTAHSGAMIRALFTETTYIKLVLESIHMMEHWDDIVGGDAGFVQNGFLRITRSLDLETLGADLDLLKKCGGTYDQLTSDELKKLVPEGEFINDDIGIFLSDGGYADPVKTTLTLARAAERHGAELWEGTQVNAIETEAGRVCTVRTDRGAINTPIVVNCAGVWSGRVAQLVGIELPIEVHRTPTCLFRKPEDMSNDGPLLSDGVNQVYLRAMGPSLWRAAHFGWSPSPADPDDYDETVSNHQIDVLRTGTHERYEPMRRTPYFGGFSALYDMTPDGHPIMGEMAGVEGFWCNCGWSGNGFASAPAAGRALAQMIVGQSPDTDLSLFAWPRSERVTARADMSWVYR